MSWDVMPVPILLHVLLRKDLLLLLRGELRIGGRCCYGGCDLLQPTNCRLCGYQAKAVCCGEEDMFDAGCYRCCCFNICHESEYLADIAEMTKWGETKGKCAG